ncbi:putative DUF636 domain-containing protein [Colletotrichum sublineola]|uniref:Putative DUF636 domain-containing protein n=1 Tax=Colletotrichum sublineola TaxID=1173701 RepID=A0A066XDA1_COLSU|nr:putative DUF636 domain-containing protein [Colletotrichum sublineola]
MTDSITIKAHCLCNAYSFSASVAKSALPLKAACCHCTSCRRLTGSLYSTCAQWPNLSEDLSGLKKYSYSKHIDVFSCGTCSTKLFCRVSTLGSAVYVVTGALENTPGLVKYSVHLFVGDTIDGGASAWLPRSENGEPVMRWKQARGSQKLPLDWPTPKAIPVSPSTLEASPAATPFHCHCKSVRLLLRGAADLQADPARDSTSTCISPETLKFKASLDSCDSCRLTYGSDVSTWAFAPLTHIRFAYSNEPAVELSEFPQTVALLKQAVLTAGKKDPRLGTLAVYSSSPDVDRYFCSTCFANVFYAVHDREDMVDIAVGLLDHPDGARAEGLLAWSYGKVGWEADVAGGWREELVASVKTLSKEWAALNDENST